MTRTGRGTLAIADIGGYTKYLTGVELEHSHDILADLISVVAQSKGTFSLAKLEGDAIFSYAPEGSIDTSHLIAAIDSSYFAFRERLRDIAAATTCECGACRLIPQLSLKYVVHHGEYVEHEVMGNRELVGSDVIVVHRMLKNDVVEKTAVTSYALFSQSCLEHFGIDPAGLEMVEATQTYDDVGEISGYVIDMDARWAAKESATNVYVSEDESWVTVSWDLSEPPDVVWDVITSPKRLEWMTHVTDFKQQNPAGVRGIGTTNHCVHGKSVTIEHVLDWKPYDYFTIRSFMGKPGVMLFTWELTPGAEDGTRLVVRAVGEGSRLRQRMQKMMMPVMRKKFEEMGPEIENYLGARKASQPELVG